MQLESMSSSDETQAGEVESTTGGTYAERRKSSKPIMEKRRRARINSSLNELKSILLEALKKDSTRHSKLEKADILEMTVKYLKNVERQQRLSVPLSIDPSVVDKYKAGFNECRNEVMRFLSTCEGVTVDVRTRLLNHLASCLQAIQTQPSIFDESPVNLDVAHQSIQATPLFSNGQAIQVHFSEAAVPIALNRGHHNPIIAPKRPILKQAITGQEQPITVVHTSGHSNTTPSVVLPDSIQIASSISGFGSPNIAFLLPSGGNTTTALLRPVTDSPNQLSPEQPLVLRRLSPSSTSPSPRKKSIAEGRDSPSTDRKIKLSEKFSSQEILNKDTSTFSTSQFALNLDTPKTLKRHRLIGTEIKQFTNYVESVPADSTVPKRRRYESKDWDNTKTACQGVIDDVHPNVLEEINFSAYKDDCHGEDESSTCQRQSEFEYSDESPLGSKEQTSADRNTIPYPDETCSPNVNSQKVHKSEPWRPWSKAKVVSE